ncbi:YhhA family cyclophane-containing RiPP [Sphingomonas sp. HMP6]|uniref:YhhA family cyclophane-containing RiPP n=1 Tax=Sphingomonas sp. HMP6 TaxID=1517551 RepID=UPI001596927F|nr:YhhA family cyclophane-containing RiPP [Sphingomonas sp. HMP6]
MSEVIDRNAASTRSAVIASRSANPALQRLRDRVVTGTPASDVITSYDRMHHRHSRS